MLQSSLFVRIGANYANHKGQIQLIEHGCDKKETSASTLHQPMKHTYMCTLSLEREREREEQNHHHHYIWSVFNVDKQQWPVSEREAEERGGRGGG